MCITEGCSLVELLAAERIRKKCKIRPNDPSVNRSLSNEVAYLHEEWESESDIIGTRMEPHDALLGGITGLGCVCKLKAKTF